MRVIVFEHIANCSRSRLTMLQGRAGERDLNAATLVDAEPETRRVL